MSYCPVSELNSQLEIRQMEAGNGLWVENQGYEFVLTLGAAALLLGAVGAGRYSIDNPLSAKSGRTGVTV
jgi:uncharacterized membrane protein YphA (DoxX/SURF4 family)